MKECPKCGEPLVLDHNYNEEGDIVGTLICENTKINCDYEEHYSTTTNEEAEEELKTFYESLEE
ncbi:hypothetical protein [Faecalimicrobium dakarense]|uniref:hypothetical protein n=1 Tax=Faecalimicrobium dakarense TaxID=1301100 RepID=UPI0004AF79B1|nr:hypothetical protein [[Clostridium] dakarense]